MKPFAAKLRSGQQFLGLGFSEADLRQIESGVPVFVDLASIGAGLWFKEPDGSRTFLQPRESRILLIPGDTTEDVGAFLSVDLSSLEKP